MDQSISFLHFRIFVFRFFVSDLLFFAKRQEANPLSDSVPNSINSCVIHRVGTCSSKMGVSKPHWGLVGDREGWGIGEGESGLPYTRRN